MNVRPKPNPGGHYQIIAVALRSDSSLVGTRVWVVSWDDSGHRAPWGILNAKTEGGKTLTDLECAIKRVPVKCECDALPFPHKPGVRCKNAPRKN